MKLDRICRTCLVEKSNLKPLFEACVANMLMSCASIQVMQGDGLPHQICTQCLQSVNKAYSFKQLCEKSDLTLRNYLDLNLQSISIQTDNILNEVKTDLFTTNEVLQQTSIFQDIFNDATTHSLVETFTNQNAGTVVSDLAETMQSLQTIAEQCLPESWESDGQIVPCNSEEATDNIVIDTLYKCQFCSSMFKDEWSLAEHIKNHTGQSKYFCNMCEKACNSCNELNKHIIEHAFLDIKTNLTSAKGKEVICSICDRTFSDAKYFKKHLTEVHFIETGPVIGETDKKHSCNVCGKRYRLNKNLAVHMRIHTGERPLNCDVCGKTFAVPSSLHKHKKIHNAEKKHVCTTCGKRFNQSSNLNNHLLTHTGEKTHVCHICEKSFLTNTNLEIHMRSHTGVKPYRCSFCQKTFTTSTQMKKHRMVHTGEKPYPCWQCGRCFRRKETRDTHVRYHTGERPYSCEVCSKKYIAASHLRDHMKTHSDDRKYECPICLKKFFDARTLKNHAMTHTGQKPFSCQICGKTFTQNGGLILHSRHCRN